MDAIDHNYIQISLAKFLHLTQSSRWILLYDTDSSSDREEISHYIWN